MAWLRRSREKTLEEIGAEIEAEARAQREAAAARGEEFAVPFDLGVQWSVGAPLPHLLCSGFRTFVAFYLEDRDPDWDGREVRIVDPTGEGPESLALAEFVGCVAVRLGPPNDEVLHGHPLDERGLVGYEAHVVENSRWLAELTAINRVHDRFDPEGWQGLRHFLFVFHDECIEAIASEVEVVTCTESMPALLTRTIGKLWEQRESR
jgi:hypothetical protein